MADGKGVGPAYSVDYSVIDKIAKQFGAIPREVENIVNSYIHETAPSKIRPAIMGFVPVSNRQKRHAKDADAFSRQEDFNLGVRVMTAKQFNYLVFPDEGRGTSRINNPQNFTGRGVDAVRDELIEDMNMLIVQSLGIFTK